jgi:transposase
MTNEPYAIHERLDRIEELLIQLIGQRFKKEFYSTSEAARILSRAEFTVREWCRLGRVDAIKRKCGRGSTKEWALSHQELTRIQNEGLLPK